MKKWFSVILWTMTASFIYYVLESFVGGLSYSILQRCETTDAQNTIIVNVLVKMLALLVFCIWYYRREKKYKFRPAYRQELRIGKVTGLAVLALFLQYSIGFFMTLLRYFMPAAFEQYDKMTDVLDLRSASPGLVFLLVVILGPVAEEVVFRGIMYGKLREVFSIMQAAVISGAIFGVYHRNLVQGIYAMLAGIVLAYVYEKTGTLIGSVLLHIFFNFSAYVALAVNEWLSHFGVPAWCYFCFDILCVMGVVLALTKMRKKNNRYGRYDEISLDLSS